MFIYYTLLESYPAPVVESSFLTFLSRVKTLSEQNVNPGYQKLLMRADSKFGDKLKSSVFKMATRGDLEDGLRFFELLTGLR